MIDILVKFPTRGRKEKAISVLKSYYRTSKFPERISYLLAIDSDDQEMLDSLDEISEALEKSKLFWAVGERDCKVEAINRGINEYEDHWDVLVLGSDDMIPAVGAWDAVIESDYRAAYNKDAFWYFDGHQDRICTLPIMTSAIYYSFGYIYHPDYKSLWCDNEWTEVMKELDCLEKKDEILFRHESPAWKRGATTEIIRDSLWLDNESFFQRDRQIFEKRREKGFPIDDSVTND